jgi:hypothetical protein
MLAIARRRARAAKTGSSLNGPGPSAVPSANSKPSWAAHPRRHEIGFGRVLVDRAVAQRAARRRLQRWRRARDRHQLIRSACQDAAVPSCALEVVVIAPDHQSALPAITIVR